MPSSLPERPSLEWLRKTAKQSLNALREHQPAAQLSDAQLAIAREYGFTSWRALVARVEELQTETPKAPVALEEELVKTFLRYVGEGQIDDVRRMLQITPQLVNAVGPHPFWGGRPQALHVSVETKRRETFDLLLEAGADIDGSNEQYDHWSPLMLAIQRGVDEMRDELIRRGARIGLVEALMLGDDERVDESLDREGRGALLRVPNGGSVLMFARTVHASDRLIALGAPIDVRDRWGVTPVQALSRLGEKAKPLVRRLVERGARVTPEEYARIGDQASLQGLLQSAPEAVKSDGVVIAAVEGGHVEVAKWLLSIGANVNARAGAPTHRTPLHAAAWNGDLRMVELLVDSGADLTIRDDEHNATARHWAETAVTVKNSAECKVVAEYLAVREKEGAP